MATQDRFPLLRLPSELVALPARLGADIAGRFRAAGSENRVGSGLEAFANPGPTQARDAFMAQREADPQFFAEYETAIGNGDAPGAFKAVARKAAMASARGEDVSWLGPLMQQASGFDRATFDPLAKDAPMRAGGVGMRGGEKPSTIGEMLQQAQGTRSVIDRREELLPGEKERMAAQTDLYGKQAESAGALAGKYGAQTQTENAMRDPRVAAEEALGRQRDATASQTEELTPGKVAQQRAETLNEMMQARQRRADAQSTIDRTPAQIARDMAAAGNGGTDPELARIMQDVGLGGEQPQPPAPAQAPEMSVAQFTEGAGEEIVSALEGGTDVTVTQLRAALAQRGITGDQASRYIRFAADRYQ